MIVAIAISLSILTLKISASDLQFNGAAIDPETYQLLYTENHLRTEVKGEEAMISKYLSVNGDLLAKRTVIYNNDRVSSYQLERQQGAYKESIVRRDNKLIFSSGTLGEQKTKSISLKESEKVVIDAGFSNFVIRNWEALMLGKSVKGKFASMTRMNTVKVRLKRTPNKETDDAIALFELTAANALIRLLIEPVEIGYFKSSKQLTYYKGASNLKTSEGESFNVIVNFSEDQFLATEN